MKDIILLHHSGILDEKPQYDRIRAYHHRGAPDAKGKLKWPADRGIQYAYVIEREGDIIEGNPPERVTYHAGSWKWNQRAIGVCLSGDFRTQKITGEQLHALVTLVKALQKRFDIPDENILNHRQIRSTECPGRDIREMVLTEKNKLVSSNVEHLRKVIDRSESPRKQVLQRLLSRLIRMVPL
jgi:N-acetyl-anhydromuramyl-L-alanine amidase AmpD